MKSEALNSKKSDFLAVGLILLFSAFPVSAFHGAIEGRVFDNKNTPLTGAQVWLEGYAIGTTTDTAGNYFIEVPMHGEYRIAYQFIGFKSETLTVFVQHGQRVKRDVHLQEISLPVPPVEVRGRQEVVHESKTPAPTAVVPQSVAEQAGKSTIGEAATLEAGVQLQKRCSACEASEVSIQGLPGRFSLILFEGMPLFAGLASRYILDIIPVEFIDRLEVLKGASGALWGSDAIAGAVNILLLQPVRPFEGKATYTRRSYGNDLSALLGSNLKPLGVSLIGAHSDRNPVDLNQDGIAENTSYQRNILLTNLNYYPGLIWRFNLGGSFGEETRRSGAIVPDSEYRTNPLAEKIQTRRWDLWQRTSFTAGSNELSYRLALSQHTEGGLMEMRDYSSQQFTLYSEFTSSLSYFISGISFSRQVIRDNRLFTQTYREDNLGIWTTGKDISLSLLPLPNEILPALRLDLNSAYGTIFSPYAAVKLYPGFLDLNFAAGTGFRTPTVIFESMENLPCGFQYAIRRDPELTREASFSLQAGAAKRFITPTFIADIRLNLFQHRVRNLITAELLGIDTFSRRALFYYHNLDDIALSTGMEFYAGITLKKLTAVFNAYILSPQNGNHQTLPFVKRFGINPSFTYKIPRWRVEFNTTGEINGPMLVQTVYENGGITYHDSPLYSVLNIRLSKELGIFRLSMGANNIWDYHQPPLSPYSSTEYYWGPIIGRELYATVSLSI
ncbi:MAG: TonB-dependent receptor [candidate division WOR-3 bacterium]